ASACVRPSRALAGAGAARAGAPPSRRCPRPSAGGRSSRASSRANGSEQAVGPVVDGVTRGDEAAQLGAPARIERTEARGEALRIVALEAQLARQQVVEDGVRGEHRQARGGSLVDDLV